MNENIIYNMCDWNIITLRNIKKVENYHKINSF